MTKTIEFHIKLFKERFLFKVHPQIEQELAAYIKILNNSSTQIDQLVTSRFEFHVNTGINNESYIIQWSVDSLLKCIKRNAIASRSVPIDLARIHSTGEDLDLSQLEKYVASPEITEPIILARYGPTNHLIVADGNHRFHAAKRRGDKTINAIVLAPFEHVPCMYTEKYRNLYIIHRNLTVLLNYCCRYLPLKYRITKTLESSSYYPLSEKEINFSLGKKLNLVARQLLAPNNG